MDNLYITANTRNLADKNNNYQHHKVPHRNLSDLGWEIYPEGLYYLTMHIKGKWGHNIPILITENGVADGHDRYRAPFVVAHIWQVKRALDAGVNVIGYLHWSFLDNYEWLEGYKHEAKFGLLTINFVPDNSKSGKQLGLGRQITKGAQALEMIIRKSFADNKDGKMSKNAILAAQQKFGTYTSDSFPISSK